MKFKALNLPLGLEGGGLKSKQTRSKDHCSDLEFILKAAPTIGSFHLAIFYMETSLEVVVNFFQSQGRIVGVGNSKAEWCRSFYQLHSRGSK
jgi:hypothetical protein